MPRSLRLIVLGLQPLLLLLGCSGREPVSRELPARAHFVALTRDFADFRSWGSFRVDARPAQGETHAAGELRLYVNALPSPTAEHFPVGTVIVKDDLGKPAEPDGSRKLFAMVKRGGGFNQSGAKGWEWFELVEKDERLGIVWRGLGAPDGEGYGGDPLGTCSSCHQMKVKNDYVMSKALALR